MNVFSFNNSIRQQIRKVVDYANNNIYYIDDLLDMMNSQMEVPGAKTEHLVLVPIGRWICYYVVDHPEHGRCHYFTIKPDASGKLPDKPALDYIIKEFGIESQLLEQHININNEMGEITIILPII